jgi:hypothetical protein
VNTAETIAAIAAGAGCYLATLGTAWKALAAVEARLRLVAPPKAAAVTEAAGTVEELDKRRAAS